MMLVARSRRKKMSTSCVNESKSGKDLIDNFDWEKIYSLVGLGRIYKFHCHLKHAVELK